MILGGGWGKISKGVVLGGKASPSTEYEQNSSIIKVVLGV